METANTGELVQISPLVRRLTATNSNIMTGPGTNTYLLGWREVVVIDPGPKDSEHIDRIIDAATQSGGRVSHILVTHTHRDHSPAAAVLAARTGAPLYGMTIADDGFQDTSFVPEYSLTHGDVIATDECQVRAVHTPGHIYNHFCFLLEDEAMLFAGDHLMQGTTVVIIPPHGVMADYINSLKLLLEYPLESIAPGHGGVICNPKEVLRQTVAHRLEREQIVLKKLTNEWQASDSLVRKVYVGLDPRLLGMAERSLTAHLIKLESENRAEQEEGKWRLC